MRTIVPIQLQHVETLSKNEGAFFTGVNDVEHVRTVINNSVGFSVLRGAVILGCGGMILQWPGVGLLWMIASAELRQNPRFLLTASWDVLDRIRVKCAIHRFQAFVDPENVRHVRFVEALGFVLEGRMVKHTVDRRDHLLYARTY